MKESERVSYCIGYRKGYERAKTTFEDEGYWIFDDECKEHGHCPHCGYGSVDFVDGEPHNFCRNCGAKLMIES